MSGSVDDVTAVINSVMPNVYKPIAKGSPWAVPSFDLNSLFPLGNNHFGEVSKFKYFNHTINGLFYVNKLDQNRLVVDLLLI